MIGNSKSIKSEISKPKDMVIESEAYIKVDVGGIEAAGMTVAVQRQVIKK